MTTLIGWIGVDSRRATSVYLASDSRFTWTDGSFWDYGKKLFSPKSGNELLGYCGDVLFTSQVLSQVLDQMDAGVFALPDAPPDIRADHLMLALQVAQDTYPESQRKPFEVAYVARTGQNMAATFYVATLSWANGNFTKSIKALPTESGCILALGSGGNAFDRRVRQLTSRDKNKRTSRLMYTAFCDHILSHEDRNTGGSPQLVGLFSSGPAQVFGIIHNGERWISGARIPPTQSFTSGLPWRDDLFQVCDGATMSLATGAQRQPKTYSTGP